MLKKLLFKKIVLFLKKRSCKDIKPLNVNQWKNGYAYFVAERNEKKIFIKVDTKFHFLKNDVKAFEKLNKLIPENLIEIISYEKEESIEYLFFDFYDGVPLSDESLLRHREEIYRICNALAEVGLVHRDLKFDNFLSNGDTLKIIDFTFSISLFDESMKEFDPSKYRHCHMLHVLGGNYSPHRYMWDDYYSLDKIFSQKIMVKTRCNINKRITYAKRPMSFLFKIEFFIKEKIKKLIRFNC